MNTNRMKELIAKLNKAADAYYNGKEIMSDYQYDALYDELVKLEAETGIILANSPTQKVGYEPVSAWPKVKHPKKILSLDKTKSREDILAWLGDHTGFLSWKLDGLTIVLTYEDGKLISAVTRGNGEVGEDVTPNAKVFNGVPLQIPIKGKVVVRGESLMKYSDFNRVNETLPPDEQYKNPRNLAVGTVRNFNPAISKERGIYFYGFNLVEGIEENSFAKRIEKLQELGFGTVFGEVVTKDNLIETIDRFESVIAENEFPSDGLVLMYNDVAYGLSLGETSHHPRYGIAFKWKDETAETTLRAVEWSASRTGLLNPVAIFDTVDLEGTNVSRASVHNVSIVKELKLGLGDTVSVYKANMIIPQIAENITKSGTLEIPTTCPICGGATKIMTSAEGIETLVCSNEDCSAKKVGMFEHFVSRDAMNIVGVSTSLVDTLVSQGMVKEYADFYHLDRYKTELVSMGGFGEKSYKKMIDAIEATRTTTTLDKVLYALGIEGIGRSASKNICAIYDTVDKVKAITKDNLLEIDGIGEVLANAFVEFFEKEANIVMFDNLIAELTIAEAEKVDTGSAIAGKVFVITGSTNIWASRNELKAYIESKGAKVASAVSGNTNYLINNDATSNSSKNKKAKELGISIITEEEFKAMAE